MARFAVTNAFVLAGRANFVLAGKIAEGTIRKGMRLHYAEYAQHELEIVGIEFVDHILEKRYEIGLRLPLQRVHELNLDDPKWWVGKEFECR